MSRPQKRKKNRHSSRYVALEVMMPCQIREKGVFTSVLQGVSPTSGEAGERGTVWLKVSDLPNPFPPFHGHVLVCGEAKSWRHVLAMAEIIAEKSRGAIYRPGAAIPLVSHMKPVDWGQISAEPIGRLFYHVYEKSWILRKRGVCREHLKAYLPHFTDENIYFSESGHILSDVQIFGRAMRGFK